MGDARGIKDGGGARGSLAPMIEAERGRRVCPSAEIRVACKACSALGGVLVCMGTMNLG